MAIFDYNTEAELSPTESEVELFPTRSRRTRQPLGFGRFARAADAIRFAIEELPPQLLLAAQLKVGEKRFGGDGIRRLYESAEYPLARRADNAVPYNNRGVARRKKGDLNGAIKDSAEAIRLKPDFALAYYNRGVARSDKGDLDGAIKDYAEAIRLKPDFALAYYNRGLARHKKATWPTPKPPLPISKHKWNSSFAT
jgi:tetratricopeptide (TPR) repeat protein